MNPYEEVGQSPAFPSNDDVVDHPAHGLVSKSSLGIYGDKGISIRDYIACEAITAATMKQHQVIGRFDAKEIAETCYEIADAMLFQRVKKTS